MVPRRKRSRKGRRCAIGKRGNGAGFKQRSEPGHIAKRMFEQSPEGGQGAIQLIFYSYLNISEEIS